MTRLMLAARRRPLCRRFALGRLGGLSMSLALLGLGAGCCTYPAAATSATLADIAEQVGDIRSAFDMCFERVAGSESATDPRSDRLCQQANASLGAVMIAAQQLANVEASDE